MNDKESIFQQAFELAASDQRAYLDKACGEDSQLRREIEELLAAARSETDLLQSPLTGDFKPSGESAEHALLPSHIGQYKILQRLGEGGFGIVYMAAQERPVARKVAIKVIKPGMNSKEVIARFEAERQVLAMMEHPNIARVFDAGTTDDGLPFFVMELVRGVPITEFADKNKLNTTKRLELFADVCDAVQHAHRKGIIHRDIKPSNVMVTLRDGKPVVKVIDFGVSKALNQKLTDKTLFTAYGQMIGTPQYMSPEQAEMSELDIDTRSDVYSLGVLLYELLTGSTPLTHERIEKAGFAELQRLIREEDAQKLSDRISTLGERISVVADNRGVEPGRLRKLLSGELNWIVLRALEKERDRRYESPSSLADDVSRFLVGAVVAANPPSNFYRACKFIRRNRRLVLATSAVILSLIAGLAAAGYGLWRARKATELATTRANELGEALAEATASRRQTERLTDVWSSMIVTAEKENYTVKMMLDDIIPHLPEALKNDPLVEAEVHLALMQKRNFDKKFHANRAIELLEAHGGDKTKLGRAYRTRRESGDTEKAFALWEETGATADIAKACFGESATITTEENARYWIERGHAALDKKDDPAKRAMLWYNEAWHIPFYYPARLQEGIKLQEKALAAFKEDTGWLSPDRPSGMYAYSLRDLARLEMVAGKPQKAYEHVKELIKYRKQVHADFCDHYRVQLAALAQLGRWDEIAAIQAEDLGNTKPDDSVKILGRHLGLAHYHWLMGNLDEAERRFDVQLQVATGNKLQLSEHDAAWLAVVPLARFLILEPELGRRTEGIRLLESLRESAKQSLQVQPDFRTRVGFVLLIAFTESPNAVDDQLATECCRVLAAKADGAGKFDGRHGEYLYPCALFARRQGRTQEAIDLLKKLIDHTNGNDVPAVLAHASFPPPTLRHAERDLAQMHLEEANENAREEALKVIENGVRSRQETDRPDHHQILLAKLRLADFLLKERSNQSNLEEAKQLLDAIQASITEGMTCSRWLKAVVARKLVDLNSPEIGER